MNRALRKRAKRLYEKSQKSLSKLDQMDLQTVSNRMSTEQYCQTLSLFQNQSFDDPSELGCRLAADLMDETESLEKNHVPNFIPPERKNEINCCEGCAWCCHEPLQVSILDAISVARNILDSDRDDELLPKLEEYQSSIAHLGQTRERLKESFEPCPFLSDYNKCTVYEARPVICRAFHSTDVGRCEAIIDNTSENRDVPMFTPLFGFRGLRLSGARRALKDLGLDDRPVVLARAVKILLEDFDTTVEAWLDGEPVFEDATVQ